MKDAVPVDTMPGNPTRLRWLLLSVVLTAAGLLAACTPPSSPPAPLSQTPPIGTNGMTADGSSVWVADLLGRQVLRFDPDTGTVEERYGSDTGVCGTDDLVVVPGGDLVATCPGEGLVIRIRRGGGGVQVLADVGPGVNPIALDPSGTSVLVGFGTADDDRILRVPLDGSAVSVVADGLPVLNGFSFGPDGDLYVPTGGIGGILGGGSLGRVDVTTGSFTPITLKFPAESAKHGLSFACGTDVAADGTVFVAQCFDPAVYAVDPLTGVSTLVGHSGGGFADNVEVLADGRVLLSSFLGGHVTVFTPGYGGWSTSTLPIGSAS